MSRNICFIDFETTGIDLIGDCPIQLGASLADWKTGEEIAKFCTYIKPTKHWGQDDRAFKIHGIEYETAMKGLSQKQTLDSFFNIMGYDYSFGAWNTCFDVQFFRRMCYENGFKDDMHKIYYRHFDLQSYVRGLSGVGLLAGVQSLDDLRRLFGIKREDNHDAYQDANITRLCHMELDKYIAKMFFNPDLLS